MDRKCKIAIFCSSKDKISPEWNKNLETLFQGLDNKKYSIVYGGGTTGTMGKVANLAKWYGLILESYNLERFSQNPLDDNTVNYKTISNRQTALIENADFYIALPGGYGTLFELLQVLTQNDIGETDKPIYIYNADDFFTPIIEYFKLLYERGFCSRRLSELRCYIIDDFTQISFLKKNY